LEGIKSTYESQKSQHVHHNTKTSVRCHNSEMGMEEWPVEKDASKHQQQRIIKSLKQESLVNGDVVYLVAHDWYSNWEEYIKRDKGHPGPVNNSSLLNQSEELLPHLVEDEDFCVLPERAWECLVMWYGHAEGQEPIKRPVIMQGLINKELCLELYPMKLYLYKYEQGSISGDIFNKTFSKSDTLEFLKREIRETFRFDSNQNFSLFVTS